MSSATAEWGTPPWLFNFIQGNDPFTLDVCATRENTKVPGAFYTLADNALTKPWFGRWWCNPPYGRKLKAFATYGVNQVKANGSTGTWLVPARVDTKWFKTLFRQSATVLFIEGRIPFLLPDGTESDPAPFPSAIIEIVQTPPKRPVVDLINAKRLAGVR